MRTAIFATLLTLAGTVAQANELQDYAVDGLQTCAENFFQSRETLDALKADGWRYEGNLGGPYQFLSRNSRRVVMGTNSSSNKDYLCMTLVSKMTAQEAANLGATFVQGKRARPLTAEEIKDLGDRDVVAAWLVDFDGKVGLLAAMKPVKIQIVHGAVLALGQLPN